jgi:hypothetical protein
MMLIEQNHNNGVSAGHMREIDILSHGLSEL